MPEKEQASAPETDQELARVAGAILAIPNLNKKTTKTLRKAVDNVLQGDRTGRYSIQSLSKEDKAHIGTQVEQQLKRDLFKDREGKTLDTVINDIEVDIKNTIGDNWMIPSEAVGQICVLVRLDEPAGNYSVGVFRAKPELLNKPNKDQKKSVSKDGKKSIRWLIKDATFPVSVFVTDQQVKDQVFAKSRGQARVSELFRQVRERPIHRSDIAVAAAHKDRQEDLRARVRDAKTALRGEGLLVLRGWNIKGEPEEAARRGHPIEDNECISLALPPDEPGV